MLLSIGVIMIYRINPVLGMRQVVWIGMGILIFFLEAITLSRILINGGSGLISILYCLLFYFWPLSYLGLIKKRIH